VGSTAINDAALIIEDEAVATPVTVLAESCGQPAKGYREGRLSASGWARR
jgi:hypothetical protein